MTTQLYGLLGNPVAHSVSPQMMHAAFREIGLAAVYVPFQVDPMDLQAAVAGLKALGAGGSNVTIPHKQAVFNLCADVTEEARLAKAVNTIAPHPDGSSEWIGHNTDVYGWWLSVAPHAKVRQPSRIAIIGAGGAARAVLTALAKFCSSADVWVTARRMDQASDLCRSFAEHLSVHPLDYADRHRGVADADWVIQTTPVGMWPHEKDCVLDDDGCFETGQVVQDIVYRPLETSFLLRARQRGATVVDGLGMLVGQGVKSFEIWTGLNASYDVMRTAALNALNGSGSA